MLNIYKILLALLLSSFKIYAGDYWLTQTSPTVINLTTCFFTDSLNGWIGGDSGLIIHTTNKGQSWTFQKTGVNYFIVSMYFVNERIGYGLSWETDFKPPNFYGTRILSTTNGGNNWSNHLYPDTSLFMSSIYFLDSLNGFMGGSEGKIFYTTNSGADWLRSVTDSGIVTGFPVREIKFYNSQIGFAAGGVFDIAGVIYKTINGGRNWNVQIVGSEPINDIYIIDSLNAIGVGGDFEYGCSKVRTSDAGSVWDYYEFGYFGIANSIDFRTDTEAWASLGITDSFLISTNGGNNWRLIGTPNGARIYDLTFADERNGWAVGNNGVILKYNSDYVNISENNFSIPESIILNQNYPNPFNPNTIINYELQITNYVTLKVYNCLGKEVATLVNERQDAGSYNVNFDGINLPSGVYYYKIESSSPNESGNFSDTKKMVLIK